jgi:hypothetical protein
MRLIAALLIGIWAGFLTEARADEWKQLDLPVGQYTCIIPGGQAGNTLYAGTANGAIAVSADRGISWTIRQCSDGYARRINGLCYDRMTRRVFAAADGGIFSSSDSGISWTRAFIAGTGMECRALQATPDGVYAATNAGLLMSKDGKIWRRQATVFTTASLAYSEASCRLFAATDKGLYVKRLPGGTWEKVQRKTPREDEASGEEAPNDVGTAAVAADEAGEIVAACGNMILRSSGRAANWQRISLPSSGPQAVSAVLCSRQRIFVSAKTGMFVYSREQWEDCSTGLGEARVNGIASVASAVFAASDTGIFRMAPGESSGSSVRSGVGHYMDGEPSVADVQQAAVEFADAGPEKIADWHRQARKKAWLPHFTMGLNRDTGDLWHWESGSTTKDGDDCLRKGKDSVNWSVSLIWELGDLIWNTDQTGIDARSRLNAELRQEVIDEVTKLYFERIRLKMELENLPLEERKKRREKQVRLEEVTALLDGFTGGFYRSFSSPTGLKSLAKDGGF